MHVDVERSDVVEERHEAAVAVADASGEVVAASGDVDETFFIRSAAKPFQAHVAVGAGADLAPIQLAVACASHSGDPIHLALVHTVLAGAGLAVSDLRCPSDRPFRAADRRLAAGGDVEPSPLYHNCSGKHAAMLAACVASGWPTDRYLDPSHPLQERIGAVMTEVQGVDAGPPGVDGCGAPVWRTTVRAMAVAYARLGVEDRFGPVRRAMARYPMVVSGEGRADGLIGRWLGVPAKGGAAGCLAVAAGRYGIAAKAWSGSGAVAAMGVHAGLAHLGLLAGGPSEPLETVGSPPVRGGGREVGRFRRRSTLEPV